MTIEELLAEIAKHKGNKEFITALTALNIVATKEVEAKYTDEGVKKYLIENSTLNEELAAANTRKFLAGKLGKTEKDITDEDIALELVPKSLLNEQAGKYQGKIKDYEIRKALGDKADLLKPHLDAEKIILDEDLNIKGLEEQVTGLKTKFATLFNTQEDEEGNDTGGGFKNGKGGTPKNPWLEENWNTGEQAKLYKENKELAIQYMEETGYKY